MAKQDGGDMGRQLITFQIGVQELGVDIMAVREIRAWSEPTPLPHVPDHVQGVVNLRGAILPIVDLSSLLGWGKVEATPKHVIIVMAIGEQLQGVIVDSVCDIVNVPTGQMQPPPECDSGANNGFVEGLVPFETRMITVLSLGALAVGGLEIRDAA